MDMRAPCCVGEHSGTQSSYHALLGYSLLANLRLPLELQQGQGGVGGLLSMRRGAHS